jgi:outer membrane immunogenic protein
MKIKLLATSILAVVALAGTAFAQEEGYNWTGFYAGVNLGGAFVTGCPTYTPETPSATWTGERCTHPDGFIGGGQIGFNYQAGNVVWGIEGDISGATGGSKETAATTAGSATVPAGTMKITGDHTPGSIETVRGKLGFAHDNWLFYITGGGAFAGGNVDAAGEFTPAGGNAPTATFVANNHGTRVGWVIGGGLEWGLGHHWTARIEDLYMDLGTLSNSPTVCNGAGCQTFVDSLSLTNDRSSLSIDVVRVGVNYKF